MTEATGFESCLLAAWEECDLIDTGIFGFYGPHFLPGGVTAPSCDFVCFDFNRMRVELHADDSVIFTGKLVLTIEWDNEK